MKTIDYLTDPMLAGMYWPSIITGIALALMCSLLSVLVVLKRMAFVGQGVSHAAFGGMGIAALLAAITGSTATIGVSTGQYAIVFAFCLGAGLLMALLSRRGKIEADTAIGIVLVASMALGSLLIFATRSTVQWESFLFGSILQVGWTDATIACVVGVIILATLVVIRRPLLFWAFDENAARAWGVRTRLMQLILMVMLTLATVTAMRLAGVVLATALLVLPGAAALRLSRRMGRVLLFSILGGVVGVLAGIVLGFEIDVPPGACIVCVLTLYFAGAMAYELLQPRAKVARATAGA